MTFLEKCRQQAASQDGTCQTCGNLEHIKAGLIGCIAHDKLILPEYPPYHGNVKCPNWKRRMEENEKMKNSMPEEAMKWIPVNKKLPDCDNKWGISKIVLCLDARGRIGFGIYQNGDRQLYHDGWFTGGGVGENCVKITHWMPLPAPPKENCR